MRRPGHPQDRIQGTQSSLGLSLQRQDHAVSLPNPSTRPVLSFFLFFYWHTFCTILYKLQVYNILGFPGGSSGKEPACQCRRCKRLRLDPWVRKIPWRRKWQATPTFLPGESHEQRSLVSYNPQGRKESNTTEYTHTHTHTQKIIECITCSGKWVYTQTYHFATIFLLSHKEGCIGEWINWT